MSKQPTLPNKSIMEIKLISNKKHILGLIFLLAALVAPINLHSQPSPIYPVSYRIFSPFVFNPAVAGSKDFASASLTIGNYGDVNSQLATINMRLSKPGNQYFSAQSLPEFTGIGVGGYFFNETDDPTHNIGAGVTGSYHLPLSKDAVSFLSAGITARAVLNRYAGDTDLDNPAVNTLVPNIDAGLYYYSPSFYAGIAANNILGAPDNPDSLGIYSIPLDRTYFLHIGYNIILSTPENILLEPSLIITTGDSIPDEIIDIFKPGLKLYAGDFCVGTYLNDFNKISFFGQYKYSRTYLGAYFELPWNSPYYKQPFLVEFTVGVNISSLKSGVARAYHW